MKLAKLLKAQRPDLLDGFPLKAAFKALSAEGGQSFKLAYINELLEDERVEVTLNKGQDNDLMPGFHDAGIIGALTYSDGGIEVRVNKTFFVPTTLSALERALRFQSIMAHELVHREQFASHTLHSEAFKLDDELSSIEYINDPYELEAMAAEIAHDAITAKMAGTRNFQPRFDDLTAHAAHIRPEALAQLRAAITALKA